MYFMPADTANAMHSATLKKPSPDTHAPAQRPRLRENVWWVETRAENGLLCTIDHQYEVPVLLAMAFLNIRSHCTGHNTLADIAKRSGMDVADVQAVLDAFRDTGIFHPSDPGQAHVEIETVRQAFSSIIALWAKETAATCIGSGAVSEDVTVGLLLEAWHETRSMDGMLDYAYRHCRDELKDIALKCRQALEEFGSYILQPLLERGFSVEEIKTSIPLPSTRLLHFMMMELVTLEPSAFLMIVSVISARSFQYADYPPRDTGFYHARLFAEHHRLFTVTELGKLDSISNRAHDLIHALILQAQEIRGYYTQLNGNYLPRQPVGFYSL